jgi:DNA-binding protein HU-beta
MSKNYKLINTYKMNKAELVNEIAAKAELTKVEAKKALDAFICAATEAIRKGDRISLVGFGTLSTTKRPARKGRNPQTGKVITIGPKTVVKFKASSDLVK